MADPDPEPQIFDEPHFHIDDIKVLNIDYLPKYFTADNWVIETATVTEEDEELDLDELENTEADISGAGQRKGHRSGSFASTGILKLVSHILAVSLF